MMKSTTRKQTMTEAERTLKLMEQARAIYKEHREGKITVEEAARQLARKKSIDYASDSVRPTAA